MLPDRVSLVQLGPGEELALDIDLTARCAVYERSEFVAELQYAVPRTLRHVPGGALAWIGETAPLFLDVAPSRAAASTPSGRAPLGPLDGEHEVLRVPLGSWGR
jgi:hypothetical protein